MTNAIVLIDVESGKANEAARAVAEIRGVREVYSVAGDIDLVAVINADDIDQLTEIIPGGIAKVDGVTRTRTLMAFKTFSSRDEAAAYDLASTDGTTPSGRTWRRSCASGCWTCTAHPPAALTVRSRRYAP